jgi:predicted chitinase
MTSEKLAEFRAKGMLLPSKFDRLAIIGDKRKVKEEQNQKSNVLEFKTKENNKTHLLLNFEFKLKNIKTSQFNIQINSVNNEEELSYSSNVKFSSGTSQIYQMKIPHETFNVTNKTISFEATLTTDGIVTKSKKFDLHFCNCYKKFTELEFKKLVIDIRKTNNYKKYAEVLFDIGYAEKIPKPNWKTFVDELNNTFEKFEITKCIHKIHFIAQTLHESMLYRATYEGLTEVPDNYEGGVFFQGKGIKQITHDYNYLEYYDFVKGTNIFKSEYDNAHKDREGVTEFANRSNNKIILNILPDLKIFTKRLSKEIHFACDSAGWYWNTRKLNKWAEVDNVSTISKIINGLKPESKEPNGLKERKKYTTDLKKYLNYEKCNNK